MKKSTYLFIIIGLVTCNQSGNSTQPNDNSLQTMDIEIEERYYGQTPERDTVTSYTLTNNQGMTMEVIDYGGIIVSLTAPDREGNYEDVVLGFDSLQPYIERNPFFGALVGRYGNRIAKGKFSLDSKE